MYVDFAPTSYGAKTANLHFVDSGAGSPQDYALTGTGGFPPTVDTNGWASPGLTTATVTGSVNPKSEDTYYAVDYAPYTSAWCSNPAPTPPSGGSASTTPVDLGVQDENWHGVQVALSGLTPGTKYCAELYAYNATGSTRPDILSSLITFTTTVQLPTISTNTATPTSPSTATVTGTVNPEDQATTYYAQYDLQSSSWCSNGTGSPTYSTTPASLGYAGESDHTVSVNLTGLTPGGAYCVTIAATNASGNATAYQISFIAGVPIVVTTNAIAVTAAEEEIDGTVNPVGQATTYVVEYAPQSSQWCNNETGSHSTTTVTPLGPEDNGTHSVAIDISVTPQQSYCADLIATNTSGVGDGGQTWFTAGILPTSSTDNAVGTGTTTATVTGTIDPEGQSTTYVVNYDLGNSGYCNGYNTTASYQVSSQPVGAADYNGHSVTINLAGLTPNTTYCADIVASNASGSADGYTQYFTTSQAPGCGGNCGVYYTLNVSASGNGAGTITGAGVSCNTSCSYSDAAGTAVTLTAVPTTGSYFVGWSGACTGMSACTITLNSNQSVSAEFNQNSGGGAPTPPQVTKVRGASAKTSGKSFAVDSGWEGVCPTGDATCAFALTASYTPPKNHSQKGKSKPVTVGTGALSVASGATGELTFKLSSKGSALLKSLKKLKITVRVVARSPGLKLVAYTETITCKLPPKKK